MRLSRVVILCVFLFVSGLAAFSQQDYVGRFDAYGGYSFLSTPKLNLFERGFHGQFGVNWKTWLAIGGDFSVFDGHSSLWPFMLSSSKQAQLAPFQGQLPPGYQLNVPYSVRTYTFTVGPQLNLRKLKYVTFFIHPSIGGMHQDTTAKPADQIQTMVVRGLLGPSNDVSDTVVFYGVGGGMDLNVHKHVSLRFTSDFVHTNLYSNLLDGGQNDVRFSVGPAFHFGKNIAK